MRKSMRVRIEVTELWSGWGEDCSFQLFSVSFEFLSSLFHSDIFSLQYDCVKSYEELRIQ